MLLGVGGSKVQSQTVGTVQSVPQLGGLRYFFAISYRKCTNGVNGTFDIVVLKNLSKIWCYFCFLLINFSFKMLLIIGVMGKQAPMG